MKRVDEAYYQNNQIVGKFSSRYPAGK